MSRYIRTKTGIKKVMLERDTYCFVLSKNGISEYTIPKDKIIKQADSIEELCDEFVGIDSQGHYIIHNDEFIKGARIVPLEEVNYYGAIWTDKGLQFVACMNSKGELELL